ncbi:lysozyme inhibitor LprI family protein [Massilia endophytica]|uniref:lysozyme inhibitor LprI family protein n=1 Tax=Massilia endophytica TaxID=2899220 RepID=UPI0038992728
METTACMNRELHESNARLNQIYTMLTQALEKPRRLRIAQRAWLKFRDAQCAFDTAEMSEGSAASYTIDLCYVRVTEGRIATLESILPCNGCVLFKKKYYEQPFQWPKRPRLATLPVLDTQETSQPNEEP